MHKLNEMPTRWPIDGTFELTVRCNLHCKMCLFRHHDCENAQLIKTELSASQWINLAKQVAQSGTINLLITGGEAMLRPDFCEIWEGIYKQGFVITLYTNATLVTSKIMETLKKYPPHRIGITIYGASEETYEKVCGNGEAFYRAMDGIRQLKTLPSIISFRTTIIKDNFHDIDKIEVIAQEFNGTDTVLTQTRTVMRPVRGACGDIESCRLSAEDNIKLYFRRTFQEIEQVIGQPLDPNRLTMKKVPVEKEIIARQKLTLFYCDAGMKSYTITWDGKLQGCQILGAFQEDVLEKGFIQAWHDFPFQVRLPEEHDKCQKCQDKEFCSKCIAMNYAETGDLGGCPEYACQDAKVLKKYYIDYKEEL